MLESGTDPESYITEYTLVYEDKRVGVWGSEFGISVALQSTVAERRDPRRTLPATTSPQGWTKSTISDVRFPGW